MLIPNLETEFHLVVAIVHKGCHKRWIFIDNNGCRKPLWYQLLTGTDGWCTSLLRLASSILRTFDNSRSNLEFQTTDVDDRDCRACSATFIDSSRVDNTMLDLAQNNIKCALTQLTTCRPPTSVLIPLSRNMRNVLKRMKKQFAEFYFLNYREN